MPAAQYGISVGYKLIDNASTEVASSVQVQGTSSTGTLVVSTEADQVRVVLEGRVDEYAAWTLLSEVLTNHLEPSPLPSQSARTAKVSVPLLPEYRARITFLAGSDKSTSVYLVPAYSSLDAPPSAITGTDTVGISQHLVVATVLGSADTVHTATVGPKYADFVTLWAVNVDGTARRELTLAVGSALIGPMYVNHFQAPLKVLDNYMMTRGQVLLAYASVTNDVLLFGHVETRRLA